MGTPEYAGEILKELLAHKDIEVVAVFTQEDKKVGRKQLLTPPVVKTIALEHNLPLYQPKKLRDSVDEVLSIECDFIVVGAYGQILPKAIIDYRPCINLHASILPSYRGASPIQSSLLYGDTKTGVTAMLMDEGLDSGDILLIDEIDIKPDDMQEDLFYKLSEVAAKLTIKTLRGFSKLKPIKQDLAKVTHSKKITKEDGLIEFYDAKVIYSKYRAFTPWPGTYLNSGLKLKECKLADSDSQNRVGEILEVTKEYVKVGCAKGSLFIYTLQPESKSAMSAVSYINGKRLKVADILS